MSYFILDTDNNNHIDKRPMSEDNKKVNPRFSGHSHTELAKQRISESQSARYEVMRKLVRKGISQPLTEERVKQICDETIADYMRKNAIRIDKKLMNITL